MTQASQKFQDPEFKAASERRAGVVQDELRHLTR